MRASVIIPARDAKWVLPRTLAGLARQELDGGFEVIVIDNGSRDGTGELAARSAVVSQVVRRERGDGPGAARNAGVDASSGSVLAFLDADCQPAPEWLERGVAALDRHDLVQGRVLPDPQVTRGPFDRTVSVGAAHRLFETANLFVRRELFIRLGGLGGGLEAGVLLPALLPQQALRVLRPGAGRRGAGARRTPAGPARGSRPVRFPGGTERAPLGCPARAARRDHGGGRRRRRRRRAAPRERRVGVGAVVG